MNPQRFVLFGFLLPILLGGGILALAWRKGAPKWPGACAAFAFGIAFAAGEATSFGAMPRLLPRDATQAMFHASVLAMLAGLCEAFARNPRMVRVAARALASGLVPWLVLRNLARTWSTEQALLRLSALSLGVFFAWTIAEHWARRRPGASFPMVHGFVVAGGGAALALSGSASLGQIAGTLGACLGAATLVAWWRGAISFGHGGPAVPVAVESALWIAGTFLSGLPMSSAILLALAPLAPALIDRGPLSLMPAKKATLVRVASAIVPTAIAVVLAYLSKPAPYSYS